MKKPFVLDTYNMKSPQKGEIEMKSKNPIAAHISMYVKKLQRNWKILDWTLVDENNKRVDRLWHTILFILLIHCTFAQFCYNGVSVASP